MKFPLLPLCLIALTGCQPTTPTADTVVAVSKKAPHPSAKRHPATLVLGAPHSHASVKGLKEFPATLTNTSGKPLGVHCYMPDQPFYGAFIRQPGSREWEELPYAMCGVGATVKNLAPGATFKFTTVAPADDIGKEYRIEITAQDASGTSHDVKSPVALIR